jgi:hypothetical protein
MVHGEGLGDLQEPDELEPVQALGAGLIGMDLWEPGVHGGVGGDQAVDVGEPEKSTHAVHHRVYRRDPQPAPTEVADVQLHVCALIPTKGSRPLVWHQLNQRRSW